MSEAKRANRSVDTRIHREGGSKGDGSEALANALLHSHAHELVVRLAQSADALRIEVCDDGVGGALPRGGSGMRGMADRVDALGGRLIVDRPIGCGTSVVAELPLCIVIGEDQALMREGLVVLLERAGFEVVGLAADGDDLVRKAHAHQPDAVVADIQMPPTQTDEGLRAALKIRASKPQSAILVLSQHVQRQYASELLESGAGSGGVGYLLKQRIADGDSFCSNLRRICVGVSVLDPEVVSPMLGRRRVHDPVDRLTPRQRDVLALMAEGRSNAAIADRRYLSQKAVIKHVPISTTHSVSDRRRGPPPRPRRHALPEPLTPRRDSMNSYAAALLGIAHAVGPALERPVQASEVSVGVGAPATRSWKRW